MLTWRDALATILVGTAVAVFFAATRDWGWPLVGSPGSAAVAMGVLGLAACTMADPFVPGEGTSGFIRTGMLLSFVATGLVFAAAISGSETVLLALAVNLAVLWVIATARHALGR
jgi:hypothetical protein